MLPPAKHLNCRQPLYGLSIVFLYILIYLAGVLMIMLHVHHVGIQPIHISLNIEKSFAICEIIGGWKQIIHLGFRKTGLMVL